MTVVSWWSDVLSDAQIIDVGGFARIKWTQREMDHEARSRYPILCAMPRLAWERVAEDWKREKLAPLLWLSMPVHDGPQSESLVSK